jgi:OHCU decarboxylase
MRPIESLNDRRISRQEFAEELRPLFEAAEPLAEALYAARPFTSYAELIHRAESLASQMPFEDQVTVLAAHPRIGAPPATVSALSYKEQGYASEAADPDTQRVYVELDRLNREYEERFGFRFVVFVNKRPKSEIVGVLKERLRNPREDELATSLREMFRIARDRLWSLTN